MSGNPPEPEEVETQVDDDAGKSDGCETPCLSLHAQTCEREFDQSIKKEDSAGHDEDRAVGGVAEGIGEGFAEKDEAQGQNPGCKCYANAGCAEESGFVFLFGKSEIGHVEPEDCGHHEYAEQCEGIGLDTVFEGCKKAGVQGCQQEIESSSEDGGQSVDGCFGGQAPHAHRG